MKLVESIDHKNIQLAILIRATYQNDGIHFFSKTDDCLQLGYMKRDNGYMILPHRHKEYERVISKTFEVLLIKSGRVRVDFYDESEEYIKSIIVKTGDVIMLLNGGHGFKMLEISEIIEIKQGPYSADTDKVRFESVNENQVVIK